MAMIPHVSRRPAFGVGRLTCNAFHNRVIRVTSYRLNLAQSPTSAFHTTSVQRFFLPFNPADALESSETDSNDSSKNSKQQRPPRFARLKEIFMKSFETACITFASVSVIALAGYAYQKYYHRQAIAKMELAFFPESITEAPSAFSISDIGHHPLLQSSADTQGRISVHEHADGKYSKAHVEDEDAKLSEPDEQGAYTEYPKKLIVDKETTEEYPV